MAKYPHAKPGRRQQNKKKTEARSRIERWGAVTADGIAIGTLAVRTDIIGFWLSAVGVSMLFGERRLDERAPLTPAIIGVVAHNAAAGFLEPTPLAVIAGAITAIGMASYAKGFHAKASNRTRTNEPRADTATGPIEPQ